MSSIKSDLDEIVFEGRNKAYGAYKLRKDFDRTILLAFVVSAIVVASALGIPVLDKMYFTEKVEVEEQEEITVKEVELPPPPVENEEELPPPVDLPPPPPPQREEIAYVPPEIVEDEEAPEETPFENPDVEDEKQNVGDENAESEVDDDGPARFSEIDAGDDLSGTNDDVPVDTQPVNNYPDPNEWVNVDERPKPVNLDQIKRGLKFPPQMLEAGLQGKVILKILVDKNGKPIKFLTLKSPHEQFTQEALKGAQRLTFSPAIQGGRPVPFWMVVPFNFKK